MHPGGLGVLDGILVQARRSGIASIGYGRGADTSTSTPICAATGV